MKRYLLFVVAVIVGAALVSRTLPWWGAVLLLLGVLFILAVGSLVVLRGWWRRTTLHGMWLASRPLMGAAVEVHEVRVARPPALADNELANDDAGDQEDDGAEHWRPVWYVEVDMTVTPAADLPPLEAVDREEGTPSAWSPASFRLVPREARADAGILNAIGIGDVPQARVLTADQLDAYGERMVDVARVGRPVRRNAGVSANVVTDENAERGEEEDELQIEGPSRVRVIFGVPSTLPQLVKLRYWTEDLCNIRLPQGPLVAMA
jgi:hypothetical protein